MPEPVRTRTLDDTTRASDPGRVRLSRAKLKLLRPDLFGFRAWLRRLTSGFTQLTYIEEQLQHGDSRAAIVVGTDPLLVAAYTDELDCVAILRFPAVVQVPPGLTVGSRLLTVNTYGRESAYAKDLVPGPNRFERWMCFHPIIADFVSDDTTRIEARKAQIPEAEWERAALMGATYLRTKPGVARDGRPVYAMLPAIVV